MATTVAQLARSIRDALSRTPGPDGRRQASEILAAALTDSAFISATFNDQTPGRQLLYEDPDIGFCILAHNNKGPRNSAPHDHGPSWAIYGQAAGETVMSDWDLIEPARTGSPGKVRHRRTYTLLPGQAHVYNEGDLHSPSRSAPTRLIRIEGTNMERIKRCKFEIV